MKLIGLLFLMLASPAWGETCKTFTENDFTAISKARKIVFFASWCQSCIESITTSDPSKDIYIAVFDEKAKATKALEFVLQDKAKTARCIWDENSAVAEKYKVKNLPKTITN